MSSVNVCDAIKDHSGYKIQQCTQSAAKIFDGNWV